MDDSVNDLAHDHPLHARLEAAGAAVRRRASDLAHTERALTDLHGEANSHAKRLVQPDSRHRRRFSVAVVLAGAAAILAIVAARGSVNGENSTTSHGERSPGQADEPPPTTTSLDAGSPLISDMPNSRRCTYTDPAMRAISVARALTCPDGTRVFVEGLRVQDSSGRLWLCDEASGSDVQPCVDGGLILVGSPRVMGDGFIGVKQGDTLVATRQNPVAPGFAFDTPTVSMHALSIEVLAGGRTWVPETPVVLSDPGTAEEYTTLEMTWHEDGVEQRIYIYFASDGVDWWASEIRTYNGQQEPDWYEPVALGRFFQSPLGTAFVGDLDLPNLRITGLTIEAFGTHTAGGGGQDLPDTTTPGAPDQPSITSTTATADQPPTSA